MSDEEIRQSLQLELGEARMRAVVRPLTPVPPRGLTAGQLSKFFESRGICHGLEKETVQALLSRWKIRDQGPWLIAEGTPAQAGRPDGLERLAPPPRSGADDVELLPLYVKRGDRLFRQRGPREPRPGIDVLGDKVEPPETPAPANLQAGNGIVVEDGIWTARASGFLHADEGVLRIIKTLIHYHDFGSGTLRWPSDAKFFGSIGPGATIEVGGSLSIDGDVGADVQLSAESDLRIGGSIRGGGTARIEAVGRIQLHCAEGALITAGGDIVVEKSLIGCRCRTRASLRAGGDGCTILGGNVDAIGGAEVFDVGLDRGHRARIAVGRASWINDEMRASEAEIRRWALYHGKLFDDFRRRRGELVQDRSQIWHIPEKEREAFHKDEEEVLAEQQRVDERISRLRSRLEGLSASREVDPRAVIQIHGTVDGLSALSVRGRRYECGRKPLRGLTIGIFGDTKRVCAVPTALFQSSEMH